jgi:lysophospholipase L1-like esterase
MSPRPLLFASLSALVLLACESVSMARTDTSPVLTTGATPSLSGEWLTLRVTGRSQSDAEGAGVHLRQWPGTYFEAGFQGDWVEFEAGPGRARLVVSVDGAVIGDAVAQSGHVRVFGLGGGAHWIRVQVVSESQADATGIGRFRASVDAPGALPQRGRQIEFFGDSWTVGYGNLSDSRDCSEAEVAALTDTAQGLAGQVAAALDADYQVLAISGRGVVRNYAGGGDLTLPQAYVRVLRDQDEVAADAPVDAIFISLGTNDFSTPLQPDEPWSDQDALMADYVATYAGFVEALQGEHPDARIFLWADTANAAVWSGTQAVADRLEAAGSEAIRLVPVSGLVLDGCHWHPGREDHARIARALVEAFGAD